MLGAKMETRFNLIKRLMWISALVTGIIFLSGYRKVSDKPKPKEIQVKNTVTTQTLSGPWKLAVDAENKGRDEGWFNGIRPESKDGVVPGVIQQVFPGYHGVAWYWLNFRVKCQRSPDDRLLVRFGSVDYLADVWINGKHAGSFEGGETPFEFDITGLVRNDQDNLLAVRVLNPTNEPIDGFTLAQTPHINKVMVPGAGSSFNSGGITNFVELRSVPAVYITDMFATPDSKTGTVMLSVTIRNSDQKKRSGPISLKISAANGAGGVLQRSAQEAVLLPGESVHEFSLTVPEPRLWNPEDPFLYRVTAEVSTPGQEPHEQSIRCGFRDFRIINGYFHINGRRIFLKSTHTGNHMPIGMHVPMDPDFIRRDIINAKVCGFNTIRFIGSAALPEQLDFCDEIGMMIIEESYASWLMGGAEGGYSYVKGLYPPAPVTSKLEERYNHSYTEMIRRDRNHPSVVVWQLLNETENGPMFDIAHQFLPKLRQIDPTRLVLLNSGRFDGRWSIGTASNPGSNQWEHVWGIEGPNAPKVEGGLGYPSRDGAGDFHIYPGVPQTSVTSNYRIWYRQPLQRHR
jgi:beta-galactosidase/beta-glucuronidase